MKATQHGIIEDGRDVEAMCHMGLMVLLKELV